MTWGMCLAICATLLIGTLSLVCIMIECTGHIMAAIARHNKHMNNIKDKIEHMATSSETLTSDFRGLSNFYKRHEEDNMKGEDGYK